MVAGGHAWFLRGCAWLLGGVHGCQEAGHAWLPGGMHGEGGHAW